VVRSKHKQPATEKSERVGHAPILIQTKELEKGNAIVPRRTRRLAVVAGCVSGIAGSLMFGPLFLLIPMIQIAAAILQPYSPRPGRWLLAIGAFILSFYIGLFFAPQVVGGIRSLRAHHDVYVVGLLLLSGVSVALVTWSDVELTIEARRHASASPSEIS
jgi:hypothetical protein